MATAQSDHSRILKYFEAFTHFYNLVKTDDRTGARHVWVLGRNATMTFSLCKYFDTTVASPDSHDAYHYMQVFSALGQSCPVSNLMYSDDKGTRLISDKVLS